MSSKIIFGTANFNQIYGVKKHKVPLKELKKIFEKFKKKKSVKFDTSPNYGNSQKILGEYKKGRVKIFSKIGRTPERISTLKLKKYLRSTFEKTLKNLRVKKIEGVLIQNAQILLSNNGKEIYQFLYELKKQKRIKKIGISIYDFKILKFIIKKYKIDLVQAPFSIANQELVSSGWLKKLKEQKIEIHIRSIFLQGILLTKPELLPKKLKKLTPTWNKWYAWLKKNKVNSLEACIFFVKKFREINGIIIGFDSVQQLDNILKTFQISRNLRFSNLFLKDVKNLNPKTW